MLDAENLWLGWTRWNAVVQSPLFPHSPRFHCAVYMQWAFWARWHVRAAPVKDFSCALTSRSSWSGICPEPLFSGSQAGSTVDLCPSPSPLLNWVAGEKRGWTAEAPSPGLQSYIKAEAECFPFLFPLSPAIEFSTGGRGGREKGQMAAVLTPSAPDPSKNWGSCHSLCQSAGDLRALWAHWHAGLQWGGRSHCSTYALSSLHGQRGIAAPPHCDPAYAHGYDQWLFVIAGRGGPTHLLVQWSNI